MAAMLDTIELILYCIWWAEAEVPNRDVAFRRQIAGDLKYVSLGTAEFMIA